MINSNRQLYLDAIGIQNWHLKSDSEYETDDIEEVQSHHMALSVSEQEFITIDSSQTVQQAPVTQVVDPVPVTGVLSPVSEPVIHLTETTLVNETRNDIVNTPNSDFTESAPVDELLTESVTINSKPVSDLEQAISSCKLCTNRITRMNALSGQGVSQPSIFVIGEPPTAEEDRSGQYLNAQTQSLFQSMLKSINSDENYFYTGIIKCHSMTDYLYSEDEVKQCASFLHSQIEQSKPSVLVVLGAIQAQSLLQSKKTFNELRGNIHRVKINNHEYPVVVTYHPAYLLRNPLYKREALADLIMIKSLIQ